MREENELPSLPGFLDGRRRAPMSRTAGVSEERACEKNLGDVYRGVTSLFGRVLAKFPEIQFSPYFSAFVCLCLGMVSSMTSVSFGAQCDRICSERVSGRLPLSQ